MEQHSENCILIYWEDFATTLPRVLHEIGYNLLILLINFKIFAYDLDIETNRLELAIETGNNRDYLSPFWNARDHDHDSDSRGKSASDIIYAYTAEVHGDGYLVHYKPNNSESMDLTAALSDIDDILYMMPKSLSSCRRMNPGSKIIRRKRC